MQNWNLHGHPPLHGQPDFPGAAFMDLSGASLRGEARLEWGLVLVGAGLGAKPLEMIYYRGLPFLTSLDSLSPCSLAVIPALYRNHPLKGQ